MRSKRHMDAEDQAWIQSLGLIPEQEPQCEEQAFAEEAEHYLRQVNAALRGGRFRLELT